MPTITINLPDTITLNVRGNDHIVGDFGLWHADGLRRVFDYGLQRIHNDACGAVKKDECKDTAEYAKLCLETAAEVTDALASGTKRARAASTRTTDPVLKIAMEMAEAALVAALPKGVKRAKLDAEKVKAWKKDYLARNPEVMAKAEKRHEENMAALGDVEIDVYALFATAE
jgi:hypothetical protein